jgi:outer membrane protein OmpA-like peptidoglycan-associated protein
MINTTGGMCKAGLWFFIPFLLCFAGCGPSRQERIARDRLASAQVAYARATADPEVATNAPVPLAEAGRAVDTAAQAKKFNEMDHLAYLASQKIHIAVAAAQARKAENEQAALRRETGLLVLQSREREQRVLMDARDSHAEAGESGAFARRQTQKADMLQRDIVALKGSMTDQGIRLRINDALFVAHTDILTPAGNEEMNRLAAFMKNYPDCSMHIEGYTDNVGTIQSNLEYSLKRAGAVRNSLEARGISRGRLTVKGYGQAYPLAGNDTEANREHNRRVDITILLDGVKPLTRLDQ